MRSEHKNFKNLFYWVLKMYILYKLITYFGLFLGVTIGLIMSYLFMFAISKIYNLEPFNTCDLCFIGWRDEYDFFLTSVMIFEGQGKDKFKENFIKNGIGHFVKLRQKPIFLLGNYYWKTFSEDEAKGQILELDGKGLNSSEDIMNYVNNNLSDKLFSLNEFQYKVFLAENDIGQTIVIIINDHALTDGMGLVCLNCKLTDGFTMEKFPPLKKKSIIDRVRQVIEFPFYLPFCMIKVFLLRSGKTPFKFISGPTGQKKVYRTKRFDFPPIYKITKQLNCTFNDYMLAVISKVAKQYCQRFGYNNNSINIICPVSLRDPPKTEEELRLTNESGAACIQIPFIDDHHNPESIKKIKYITDKYLKSHRFAETLNYTTGFVNQFLPNLVSRQVILASSRHFDFVVSNVPGPKDPIYMSGLKLVDQLLFMRPGTHSSFIAIMTYMNKVNIWIGYDEGIECNGQEFLNLMAEEIELSINNSQSKIN
jgi:hypothetical protein